MRPAFEVIGAGLPKTGLVLEWICQLKNVLNNPAYVLNNWVQVDIGFQNVWSLYVVCIGSCLSQEIYSKQ